MDEYFYVKTIGFTFTYFDNIYTQVTISSNGYICLGKNSACSYRVKPSTASDILAGLNYDLDPTRKGSGQIYFKSVSTDSVDFTMANTYVNLLNPKFNTKNILVITYNDVLTANDKVNSKASFQIFILSDLIRSYVIFKFKSCLNDLTLYSSSGLYHDNMGYYSEDIIPNNQECTWSNVGQVGVWVTEVTSFRSSK
jgi:hypothetical protein